MRSSAQHHQPVRQFTLRARSPARSLSGGAAGFDAVHGPCNVRALAHLLRTWRRWRPQCCCRGVWKCPPTRDFHVALGPRRRRTSCPAAHRADCSRNRRQVEARHGTGISAWVMRGMRNTRHKPMKLEPLHSSNRASPASPWRWGTQFHAGHHQGQQAGPQQRMWWHSRRHVGGEHCTARRRCPAHPGNGPGHLALSNSGQ